MSSSPGRAQRETSPEFHRTKDRTREIGAYLRVLGRGDAQRLRIATGPRGESLFPTDAERAENERAERQRERAALEARVAELEGRLARRRKR